MAQPPPPAPCTPPPLPALAAMAAPAAAHTVVGHNHPPPRVSRHRAWLFAAASLLLAAVLAVAVAVPVTRSSTSSSSTGDAAATPRQLAAQQPPVRAAAGRDEAGAALQQVPLSAPMCQGVRGLCWVPLRFVTFPGTHNSNAIKTALASIAESQKLTIAQQLQAGARLFDLDVAGSGSGGPPRFGHCSGCFCSFSSDPDQNDPARVFATMAAWLNAHPRDVILVGLSNINCGDKAAARSQLLAMLAASPLAKHVATQAVTASTTLGQLVDSGQRAVLVFYDEWTTSAGGHTVGSKFAPNQPLFRIYGAQTTVDASDSPAAIDAQTAARLVADVVAQLSQPQPALAVSTPMRVLGLFPSVCFVCRVSGVCGAASCAAKANQESFVMYVLGKATARWTRSRGDQSQLVPAFNAFQVDYLAANPQGNVVAAAQRLNEAAAWMFATQPQATAGALGLGNCAWVLDDAAFAGGLACVQHGRLQIAALLGQRGAEQAAAAAGRRLLQQGASARHVLLPANPALLLRVFADGKLRREVRGVAGQAQLLDLSTGAQELQIFWT